MPVNKMLLETYLKKLKMPQAAKVYEAMAREAADNNLEYEDYLLGVLEPVSYTHLDVYKRQLGYRICFSSLFSSSFSSCRGKD